jgi:hypothetical protein
LNNGYPKILSWSDFHHYNKIAEVLNFHEKSPGGSNSIDGNGKENGKENVTEQNCLHHEPRNKKEEMN